MRLRAGGVDRATTGAPREHRTAERRRPAYRTIVIVTLLSFLSACHDVERARSPIASEAEALARDRVTERTGVGTDQFVGRAAPNETFDLRGYVVTYWPPSSDADLAPISIGHDAPAVGTVVVGGAIVGALDRDLTWQAVKSCCDADALRLEGRGWMASYRLYATNIEDGFAPRVLDGTETGNEDRFLLAGCYMAEIRDDAVENDDLMSGRITDCLFDGVNRFVSERPTEGTGNENPDSVVTIDDVLVHMEPMPNERSDDGSGNGSIFKWSSAGGRVVMRDSVIYLEERSQTALAAETFPPGTYRNVTLVLGEGYGSAYPAALPDGVSVTTDVGVWEAARERWLREHAGSFPAGLPPWDAADPSG